ncbi:MAG: bifunctional diguanylate cyclase/phosphodiesterase [Spirochaetaceae bacterium]|nr:MAG: bifunctional diguanylate cyclase/phosphodiesterase [Spirochaetaceae bacterium]
MGSETDASPPTGAILREVSDIFTRSDVPDDVKARVRVLAESVDRLENNLESTLRDLQQLGKTVQEQERRKQKLEQQLIYNRKTGLPNHVVMDRDIHAVINEAEQSPTTKTVSLVILDLDDQYAQIKQTMEAGISEWIMYRTAERIRSLLPTNARLYHTRENEFVIMAINLEGEVSELVDQLIDEVNRPFQFPEYTLSVGCTCGIAIYPEHARTKRVLLRSADIALTEAVRANRPSVIYNRQLGHDMIEKMELQNSIIRAIEEPSITEIDRQFALHFQPLVQIDSIESAVVDYHAVGAEALIRWMHPKRGMVSPGRFIPLAEETGLIVPIGYWALFSATAELKLWAESELRDLYLSVNLSPRQFKDRYLVSNISRVLSKNQIDPSRLRLEVTESSVMDDPDDSIRKIRTIHEMGIKVSIDDFGTGYSSLNYLKRFPISTIKLDKSFIEDVLINRNTQGIVRAILSMAAAMGLNVIAEGIETYEQASFLYHEGCTCIQGYYFSKPMTSDAFRREVLNDLRTTRA